MTKPHKKWKFAIGTTSLVPLSEIERFQPRPHYIMADIDHDDIMPAIEYILDQTRPQDIEGYCFRTKRGWHIYTDWFMSWRNALSFISAIPGVDKNWIRIGEKRGYLFLADKTLVKLNWPVVRMVLHIKKNKNGKT